MSSVIRTTIIGLSMTAAMLLADPAHALRCGSKLVKQGMHEAEVLAICGNPTSQRSLGFGPSTAQIEGSPRSARGRHGPSEPPSKKESEEDP